MKNFIFFTIFLLLNISCYSQITKIELSDKASITYKEVLDIRLQILAAQMSSGSFSIIDMGNLGFPVSITINEQSKIIFKIIGELNTQYPKEKQKEIISEGFLFVKIGIADMINEKFKNLNFDYSKNIIGYWYSNDALDPVAIWENESFDWITK